MPVEIRKVAYSHKLGVFLGMDGNNPVWSRSFPKGVDVKAMVAPTFLSTDEFYKNLDSTKGDKFFIPPSDMEFHEVWPKGTEATSEDCGTAGLGYWHE